jgi:YD repeat-containing protein
VGANPAIDGKVKTQVSADGTIREYAYNEHGDVVSERLRDSEEGVVSLETNVYTYFADTPEIRSHLTETLDAVGNVMSRQLSTYTNDTGGTTTTWDDVYMPVSVQEWYGSNASDYAETRYTYTTNLLRAAEYTRVGPGLEDFRLASTNRYDAADRLIEWRDNQSNALFYAYDPNTELLSARTWSNSYARTTSYFYDSLARQTNISYPDGTYEAWTYAACGCGVLTHRDRSGGVTSNAYNANKWLSEVVVTSSNGTQTGRTQYLYNSAGSATNVIDALGNVAASIYDSAGELTGSVDERGQVTTYHYDSAGRGFRTVYADGFLSSNTYDRAGRVARTARYATATSAVPLTAESWVYDALGRVVAGTNGVGQVSGTSYDWMGRVTKSVYSDDSYSMVSYDRVGNAIAQMDRVRADASAQERTNATTRLEYDGINRLTATTDPVGRTTYREYDPDHAGSVRYVRNANDQVVEERRYDVMGRVLTNIVQGVTSVYAYDALDRVVRTTYGDGTYTENRYDGSRLIGTVSRSGAATWLGYDAGGRRVAMTNSLGRVTRYAYDPVGNLTNTVDALTNVTAYTYDSMNRPAVVLRADGSATTNAYDALGRLTARTGAGAVPVSYRYDAIGRMTELLDGNTNQTTLVYGCCERVEAKIYADGSQYSYAYDPRGWLVVRTDAKGRTTGYDYNAAGQLTNIVYPGGVAPVRLRYDGLGRMTQRVDEAGIWAWTYDGESDRVAAEVLAGGGYTSGVSYAYSAATRELQSIVHPVF